MNQKLIIVALSKYGPIKEKLKKKFNILPVIIIRKKTVFRQKLMLTKKQEIAIKLPFLLNSMQFLHVDIVVLYCSFVGNIL